MRTKITSIISSFLETMRHVPCSFKSDKEIIELSDDECQRKTTQKKRPISHVQSSSIHTGRPRKNSCLICYDSLDHKFLRHTFDHAKICIDNPEINLLQDTFDYSSCDFKYQKYLQYKSNYDNKRKNFVELVTKYFVRYHASEKYARYFFDLLKEYILNMEMLFIGYPANHSCMRQVFLHIVEDMISTYCLKLTTGIQKARNIRNNLLPTLKYVNDEVALAELVSIIDFWLPINQEERLKNLRAAKELLFNNTENTDGLNTFKTKDAFVDHGGNVRSDGSDYCSATDDKIQRKVSVSKKNLVEESRFVSKNSSKRKPLFQYTFGIQDFDSFLTRQMNQESNAITMPASINQATTPLFDGNVLTKKTRNVSKTPNACHQPGFTTKIEGGFTNKPTNDEVYLSNHQKDESNTNPLMNTVPWYDSHEHLLKKMDNFQDSFSLNGYLLPHQMQNPNPNFSGHLPQSQNSYSQNIYCNIAPNYYSAFGNFIDSNYTLTPSFSPNIVNASLNTGDGFIRPGNLLPNPQFNQFLTPQQIYNDPSLVPSFTYDFHANYNTNSFPGYHEADFNPMTSNLDFSSEINQIIIDDPGRVCTSK